MLVITRPGNDFIYRIHGEVECIFVASEKPLNHHPPMETDTHGSSMGQNYPKNG